MMNRNQILKLASKDKDFRKFLIKKLGYNTTQDILSRHFALIDKYTKEISKIYKQYSRKNLSSLSPREAKGIAEKINPLAMEVFEKGKKIPVLGNPKTRRILSIRKRPMYTYIKQLEDLLEEKAPLETWEVYSRSKRY